MAVVMAVAMAIAVVSTRRRVHLDLVFMVYALLPSLAQP